MNNLMSFGIHKSWKKQLIYSMKPKKNKKLIDVACGTGDIKTFYQKQPMENQNFVLIQIKK